MRRFAVVMVLVSCLGAACSGDRQPDSDAGPAAGTELIAGTPPGDLEQWVGEMQSGVDSLLSAPAGDPSTIQKKVLDLYVGRQEYLEMYYGPGGRMSPSEGLAGAVEVAEDRFHELIALLGAGTSVEPAALNGALTALRAQLDAVLREAAQSPQRLRQGPGGGAR